MRRRGDRRTRMSNVHRSTQERVRRRRRKGCMELHRKPEEGSGVLVMGWPGGFGLGFPGAEKE